MVGEEGGDVLRGLEVALGVGGEKGAGLVEGGVVAEAGEGVGQEAVGAGGEEGGVGGEEGELEVGGEIDEEGVEALLAAAVVAGDLDVDVAGAEGGDEVPGGRQQVLAGGVGEGTRE